MQNAEKMEKLVFGLCLMVTTLCFGQSSEGVDGMPAYGSIDGIVKELIHIVSNQPGKPAQQEALEDLFLPTAHFTVLMHDAEGGSAWETIDLTSFLELLQDPYYEEGFSERELFKVVDQYNGIAQVFQTYQGADREGAQETGITSYQLLYARDR